MDEESSILSKVCISIYSSIGYKFEKPLATRTDETTTDRLTDDDDERVRDHDHHILEFAYLRWR